MLLAMTRWRSCVTSRTAVKTGILVLLKMTLSRNTVPTFSQAVCSAFPSDRERRGFAMGWEQSPCHFIGNVPVNFCLQWCYEIELERKIDSTPRGGEQNSGSMVLRRGNPCRARPLLQAVVRSGPGGASTARRRHGTRNLIGDGW